MVIDSGQCVAITVAFDVGPVSRSSFHYPISGHSAPPETDHHRNRQTFESTHHDRPKSFRFNIMLTAEAMA